MTAAATAARRRPATGHDMDTYVADAVALTDALDLQRRHPCRPFHRRRRGGALRRAGQARPRRQGGADQRGRADHGARPDAIPTACRWRCSTMVREQTATNRAQFYYDFTLPFFGYNRDGAEVKEGVRRNWWRQGMMGGVARPLPRHRRLLRDRLHRGPQGDRRADAGACTARTTRSCRSPPPARCRRELVHGRGAEVLSRLSRTACRPPTPSEINADLLAFIQG